MLPSGGKVKMRVYPGNLIMWVGIPPGPSKYTICDLRIPASVNQICVMSVVLVRYNMSNDESMKTPTLEIYFP